MFSSADEEALAAWDAFEAALDRVEALRYEELTTRAQFNMLERYERVARRLPVGQHRLINQIDEHAAPTEVGGALPAVLANRLHITRTEAARRIRDAQVLGPRSTFTGEPLEPMWPATAAAQAAGEIGTGHIKEIRRFFKQLPGWVDESTRQQAEADLAKLAGEFRPDELRRGAAAMIDAINPDGDFTDEYRANQRGLIIGRQGEDGMSRISGYLTPEARAGWDAVLSKWAAPGMCNPNDDRPTVDGRPSEEAIKADTRTAAQRNHDALNALCRAMLASGQLGNHNGLPVSIVVGTTLQELEAAAGKAHTGGGSWLPMSDVIRMAAHAHHYLTIFDKHRPVPLYLGRTKRIATEGQRIVLHLVDRGCTFPGCIVPAYRCQVHHAQRDWAAGGNTNIDEETLACPPHNRLVTEKGWKTRKRADGTTEWIPPAFRPRPPRTNNYHHPDCYLANLSDDEEADDP